MQIIFSASSSLWLLPIMQLVNLFLYFIMYSCSFFVKILYVKSQQRSKVGTIQKMYSFLSCLILFLPSFLSCLHPSCIGNLSSPIGNLSLASGLSFLCFLLDKYMDIYYFSFFYYMKCNILQLLFYLFFHFAVYPRNYTSSWRSFSRILTATQYSIV